MPITQIPFQEPAAPPEKGQPEQLGLYDAREWETAYKDLDARVPHLLLQLQDDLSRSRRREAAWISIIAHLLLIILIVNFDKLEKYFPWMHSVVAVVRPNSGKDVTFLELPPDLQKPQHKTNSNIIGDKDRVATTRHPELDTKDLRKALATPPPGRPGASGPASRQPAPAQPTPQAPNQAPPQAQPQAQEPPKPSVAQLQTPAKPKTQNDFSKYAGSMSAGSAIQEATRAAAAGRGGVQGDDGNFGLGTGAHGRQLGNLEVLSDTQGVDFGPYLQRVLHDVKMNWYSLIPESAQMKKGNLAIEFAITKEGKIADMHLALSSGDTPLDRAAWGGITASNPFPPLPAEFNGQFLSLRFRFFYNPSKEDLE